MTTAILDTNVFVQAALGSPRAASTRALRAYDAGRYRLVFSPATIDEVLEVLLHPRIRARHGWSDDQVIRFVVALLHSADLYPDRRTVSAALPRDITDTKLLALAEESAVDYSARPGGESLQVWQAGHTPAEDVTAAEDRLGGPPLFRNGKGPREATHHPWLIRPAKRITACARFGACHTAPFPQKSARRMRLPTAGPAPD